MLSISISIMAVGVILAFVLGICVEAICERIDRLINQLKK